MKYHDFKQILFVVTLLFVILITNFLLGTERIRDAYAHSFRGGECEMAYPRVSDICNKSIGFDSYYLILSALLVAFLSGFRNVIRNLHLVNSIFLVIIHSIIFLTLTEFVIWVLRIPVLFTGFMEPRQHLEYALFSGILRRGGIEFIPFLLVSVSLVGIIGNIAGYPFLFLKNKKKSSSCLSCKYIHEHQPLSQIRYESLYYR